MHSLVVAEMRTYGKRLEGVYLEPSLEAQELALYKTVYSTETKVFKAG